MTAAWSTGRNGRYPYYSCQSKNCCEARKSIRKERIEGEFEGLLQSLHPSRELFRLLFETMRDLWSLRLQSMRERSATSKVELAKLERKTDQLMERLVEADSPTLIRAYEAQVRKLEEQKIALAERIANCGRPLASFGDLSNRDGIPRKPLRTMGFRVSELPEDGAPTDLCSQPYI